MQTFWKVLVVASWNHHLSPLPLYSKASGENSILMRDYLQHYCWDSVYSHTKSEGPQSDMKGEPPPTPLLITISVFIIPCKGCLLVCFRFCFILIHVVVIISSQFLLISPWKISTEPQNINYIISLSMPWNTRAQVLGLSQPWFNNQLFLLPLRKWQGHVCLFLVQRPCRISLLRYAPLQFWIYLKHGPK